LIKAQLRDNPEDYRKIATGSMQLFIASRTRRLMKLPNVNGASVFYVYLCNLGWLSPDAEPGYLSDLEI
jgi:hypothetical protein